MKKVRIALFISLLAIVMIAGSALAGTEGPSSVVDYTGGVGANDASSTFDPPEGAADASLIRNGAFDDWEAGGPMHWNLWTETNAGWEFAHINQVDLAVGEGMNDALGFFIRNVGGSGGHYAGAVQELDLITAADYYFVNVSETIWEDMNRGPYTSVAWYAISTESDPTMVGDDEWKELDPFVYQCENTNAVCNYAGRDETVWIEPGSYFHLMVARKYPYMNGWSFFVVDDIAIVPADPLSPNADDPHGFYDWLDWEEDTTADFDEKCHYYDETCVPYNQTLIFWNPWELR